MSRKEIELSILRRKFPAYTQDIREIAVAFPDKANKSAFYAKVAEYVSKYHFAVMYHVDLSSAKRPKIGPDDMKIHIVLSYIEAAFRLECLLSTMSDEALKLLQIEVAHEHQAEQEQQAHESDLFAWFNDPECDLRDTYWNSVVLLTPDEIVALSLGKDPRKVNADKLTVCKNNSVFSDMYFDRLRQVNRIAQSKKSLKLRRSEIADWLDANKLDRDVLKNNDGFEEAREKLTTREKNSLYRIVLGMIIKNYSLDPSKPIDDDLKRISVTLEDDLKMTDTPVEQRTIRKHIKAAHAYALACHPPLFRMREK